MKRKEKNIIDGKVGLVNCISGKPCIFTSNFSVYAKSCRLQLTYFVCLYAALDFISLDAIFFFFTFSLSLRKLGLFDSPFPPCHTTVDILGLLYLHMAVLSFLSYIPFIICLYATHIN